MTTLEHREDRDGFVYQHGEALDVDCSCQRCGADSRGFILCDRCVGRFTPVWRRQECQSCGLVWCDPWIDKATGKPTPHAVTCNNSECVHKFVRRMAATFGT